MPVGLFYPSKLPLCVGDELYQDSGRTTPVQQGAYSDGTYCYVVGPKCGTIILIKPCATPTPTAP